MCIRLLYESKNFHVFTASLTPKVIVLFEVRSCDICILYLYIVIISCSTCCLVGPIHVALTGPTRQQELQLMMTRLKSKLAQTHVALTGPTRQQVLQLMMTRLESKLARTHVALTGPTRQQILQLMMTRLLVYPSPTFKIIYPQSVF